MRERAVELCREFLAGRRRFAIFGGSLSFDLDDMVAELSRPDPEQAGEEGGSEGGAEAPERGEASERAEGVRPPRLERAAEDADVVEDPGTEGRPPALSREEKRRALEVLARWKLRGCGAFLDESGRLSGWQLFRVEKFSEVVRELNYFFSRAIRESIRAGEWESIWVGEAGKDSPALGDRDRELWRKRAESGKPWLWFEGAELVIDLPITRAGYERLQRSALDEAAEAKAADWAEEKKAKEEASFAFFIRQAFAHLRRFEVGEDRVVLRFAAPDGRFRIRDIDFARTYDTKLLEALKSQGIVPDGNVRIEDVRRKL